MFTVFVWCKRGHISHVDDKVTKMHKLRWDSGCIGRVDENLDPRTVQPVASRYIDYAIPARQHFLVPYLKDHVLFAINNRYTITVQDSTHIFLLLKPVKYTRPILPSSVFFCLLVPDHDLFCVFQYLSGCWHLITTSVLPLIWSVVCLFETLLGPRWRSGRKWRLMKVRNDKDSTSIDKFSALTAPLAGRITDTHTHTHTGVRARAQRNY